MKHTRSQAVLVIFALVIASNSLANVHIADDAIRETIEKILGKSSGEVISETEMTTVTHLEVTRQGVTDLTGLETATELKTLRLAHNKITDLTPLSDITKLALVHLHDNNISDLEPLSNLTQTVELGLAENSEINDISALAGMTKLKHLNLADTPITDISALSEFIDLEYFPN